MSLHKSRSYPERLKDSHIRESENKIKLHIETIETLKEKDYQRAQMLADMGSPSSRDVVVRTDWRKKFCKVVVRAVNYFLEREEETRRADELIRRKSYAGFYYFIKWLVRSVFFLVFTTLGTIAGKETGCAIKDHDKCTSGVIELANSSPHIIASIVGSIFGLLLGQWLGRLIWDKMTMTIRHCLRKVEKLDDRTKMYLLILSLVMYVCMITIFAIVFWLFVNFNKDKENVIGAIVGGCIGVILAILAYRKGSSCQVEPETPMLQSTPQVTPYIPTLSRESLSV